MTVNRFFTEVDAFVSDDALRASDDLDEQQLRLAHKTHLIALQRR